MFSKIHETYRIYWNHHQKHACEIWGSSEKLQFLMEKCLQRRTLKTVWNLDIFSMFSKIHETYRIYWNHHQKHACEIWGSLEKLQFLTEKCLQRRTFRTGWNFDFFSMFSKIHETYKIYWNHHQKHACEIWGSLEKLQFLMENADSAEPSEQDEILTFSQCSPKFMKLTEFIEITTRNMNVKFEAFRRSYNFWQKNAYSAGPSKQDEILRFSQCSPKFMKLTEVIGITTRNMHVKFEAVRRSSNFWWKMPTAPDLQNRMKFWHFLNVLQNSWNLQNLLESPPETCMWNLRQFGEVTIFDGKMPTAPDLQNRMKFWHFLNVLQNSRHLQNLLKSPPETCMWNLRQFGEVIIFDRKMPTALDIQNRMKFWDVLNVLQNSWNLQKILESPPETCMWNLRQFGEVTIFDGKCWQRRRTFKTGWNFDIFSMFSKIHETYRIYWNHHQKHACEIWGSSEKLQFLTEKCLQRRTFKTGWNLDIFSMFSKIHETYRSYWNHHQKHACEIWGSLEKLQFLTEKCLQRRTFKTGWNLDIFSMFSKIHDTYRIYWNHHQKHACEIWGSLEKLQFLTEKCLQRRTFKTGWNFEIFSMFSKIHETYRSYWNHHQKHACEIWGSSEKFQFLMENADSAGPSKQDEILTFSQCSPKFMKLTEFIGITTRSMHVKVEAVRRSYNFWRKYAYSAGPSK